MDVDLPVFEGIFGELEVELIGQRATIILEATLNLHAFGIGEEGGPRKCKLAISRKPGTGSYVRG